MQSTHHWHFVLDYYVRAQHSCYFHGFEEGCDFYSGEVVVFLSAYPLVVLQSVVVLVNVLLAVVVALGQDPITYRVSLYYYYYY